MTQYRRASVPGATCFSPSIWPSEEEIVCWLMKSMHCERRFAQCGLRIIWTLPAGDSDFSTRWGLIKGNFSRSISKEERVSESRLKEANGDYRNDVSGSIWF